MNFFKTHWKWGPVAVGVSTGFPMLFANATVNWGAVAIATGLSVSIILTLPALFRAGARRLAKAIVVAGYRAQGAEWPPPSPESVVRTRSPTLDAPRPMSELEATLARNTERVVRSNIQSVLNELADAREAISAVNEEGLWLEPLGTTIWTNVRDAYRAIDNANVMARGINSDPRALHDWELSRLGNTVREIRNAEHYLTSYLTELANE